MPPTEDLRTVLKEIVEAEQFTSWLQNQSSTQDKVEACLQFAREQREVLIKWAKKVLGFSNFSIVDKAWLLYYGTVHQSCSNKQIFQLTALS